MLVRTDDQGPQGAGYLEIDNRPAGFRHLEFDTYTCTHCSGVVVMNPARTRPRYKCQGCNHHICDGCAAEKAAGAPCRTMQQRYDEDMQRLAKGAEPPELILPSTLQS